MTPFYAEDRDETKRRIEHHQEYLHFQQGPRHAHPMGTRIRLPPVSLLAQDLMEKLLQDKYFRLSSRRYRKNDIEELESISRSCQGGYFSNSFASPSSAHSCGYSHIGDSSGYTKGNGSGNNHGTAGVHAPRRNDRRRSRTSKKSFVFPDDAKDIKGHPFFAGLDWTRLDQTCPPWVPRIGRDQSLTCWFDYVPQVEDCTTDTESSLSYDLTYDRNIDEHHQPSQPSDVLTPSPSGLESSMTQYIRQKDILADLAAAGEQDPEIQHLTRDESRVTADPTCQFRRWLAKKRLESRKGSTKSPGTSSSPDKSPLYQKSKSKKRMANGTSKPPPLPARPQNSHILPSHSTSVKRNPDAHPGSNLNTKLPAPFSQPPPTQNVPNSKKKRHDQRRRPRDKMLRDPALGNRVLELRKRTAFAGYTYRRAKIRVLEEVDEIVAGIPSDISRGRPCGPGVGCIGEDGERTKNGLGVHVLEG